MDPPETSMTPPPGLVESILDSHARDEVSPLPGVESVYSEASTSRKGRTGRSRRRKRSSTNPTGFTPILLTKLPHLLLKQPQFLQEHQL